tara:strand:+ start:666 stop:923 length:258 start_codon:yes stop_codon:yes gene_type:complete
MITFELPVVFIDNHEEIELGVESGIVVEEENYTEPTTFFISQTDNMAINSSDKKISTLRINGRDLWSIDADYYSVREIIMDALKK